MEDRYQFVEDLDAETIRYAEHQTKKFREEYGNIPEELRENVSKYNNAKKVLQAIISKDHVLTSYEENGKYGVSLDGNEVYSTDNIIFWINSNDDCKKIAIFETSGSDFGTLKILIDGELKEEIEDKVDSISFTESSYYLVKTFSRNNPPDGGELNSHRILKDGKIVFGQGMKSNDFISLTKSKNKAIITVGDWNRSNIYSGEFENPSTWEKVKEVDVPVKPLGIIENEVCYLERKGNGIIKKGDLEILDAQSPIEDCLIVDEGFLVLHLIDSRVSPVLYDFSGNKLKTFDLETPMGFGSAFSDEHSAIFNLHSFGIPFSLYKYTSGELKKIEENNMLKLTIEDKWVNSSGANIHYFLVHSNSKVKKAVAYGYGGFNISLTPTFSPLFVTLLDNGVSLAFASLRGGGEYGEEWHSAGMREKKQHVFDDFISVIQSLKENDYKVVAIGASNGGLLVGSVLTQKPEILDGAVIGNPVLDMLRFHLLSVGKYWISEYGDPDNPEDARYLLKYSPYHNVKNAAYPKILIYSRMNDDRVHPAHAIKFHMKLNEVDANAYLRISTNGGHIGIPPAEMIKEISENSNFILRCLN